MSKKNKISMGAAIGLWALGQPRIAMHYQDYKQVWQSKGKRPKPRIK
ncbi:MULTISPECIES: hypothetical protein [Acinetobacter]|nr:hypothetical protein [Acinetobacter haemolyticus]